MACQKPPVRHTLTAIHNSEHARNIKIVVATHKPYWMPRDDTYIPLEVGASMRRDHTGYLRDNIGANISCKNDTYCELTGLYWAWKNLHADYKGIVHYRRHFVSGFPRRIASKRSAILRQEDYEKIFARSDILLPRKRHYYIETNASHYIHAHHKKDLATLENVIREHAPDYLPCFQAQMHRTSAHMFNMMVMRADLFDQYAEWLFAILGEVERCTDLTGYTTYERRVYGFLSELLPDVWIERHGYPYQEAEVAFMEHQNWLKKGTKFLMRKVKGEMK